MTAMRLNLPGLSSTKRDRRPALIESNGDLE
jgi:hypothetical protein